MVLARYLPLSPFSQLRRADVCHRRFLQRLVMLKSPFMISQEYCFLGWRVASGIQFSTYFVCVCVALFGTKG